MEGEDRFDFGRRDVVGWRPIMSATLLCQIFLPIVGLAGPLLILVGLPGTWLLLSIAGVAEWVTGPRLFGTPVLVAALALAVGGEIWEALSSSVRARRAGAGRRGSIGALAGGIGGALLGTMLIPIPVVGTLIGGGVGAFALASGLERSGGKSADSAFRIGRAAAAGHMVGLLGKLVAGVVVYGLLVVALFL